VETNAVGDLVLDEPEAMRVLADPARLALHDRLRREGPATADELGAAAQAQLEELRRVGLVTCETGRWAAVGRGIVFEIPDDPEGQAAARELANVMLLNYADLPRRWVEETEPRLGLAWARASGLFNARVMMTPDELRELQEGLERLLEPLINRPPGLVPEDAASVRILGYFLPEGP
jgi:hypothetical protein